MINGTKCKRPSPTASQPIPALKHCILYTLNLKTKSVFKVMLTKVTSLCSTTVVQDIITLKQAFLISFDTTGNISRTHTTRTNASITPVKHAQRKVPIKSREQIECTLDEMVKKGVLTPVFSSTKWVSSLIYPHKPDGTLHLCLDPKDLNKAIV